MASNGTAVSNAAPCATPAGEPEAAPHDARVLLDLLLGAERRRLDQIERRLGEHDHERRDVVRRAEDHSEVLVDAVRLTAERGEELSEALRPEVEHGLRRSIRDNPDVMADALYPDASRRWTIGPASFEVDSDIATAQQSSEGTVVVVVGTSGFDRSNGPYSGANVAVTLSDAGSGEAARRRRRRRARPNDQHAEARARGGGGGRRRDGHPPLPVGHQQQHRRRPRGADDPPQ